MRIWKLLSMAVPNRRTDTLFPLIQEWILPGTRVISDSWASYAAIKQRSQGTLTHAVVNHKLTFVHPEDPSIHTNHIENMWMCTKSKIKMPVWNE